MMRDEIELAKQRETERANRATEDQNRRSTAIKAATDIFGTVAKGLGGFKFKPKNDWSWHGKHDQIEKSAQADFNYVRGSKLPNGMDNDRVLGARVTYTPTLGNSNYGRAGGYSLAATKIFNLLRGTGGYNPVYTAQDIGKYLLGIEAPALVLARAIRAYRVAAHFNNVNDVQGGKAVCGALGFDFDQMQLERGDTEDGIVQAITAMQELPYPVSIHVVDRHLYLESSVFVDDDGERPNVIVPTFDSLPIYEQAAAGVWYDGSYRAPMNGTRTALNDLSLFWELYNNIRYNDDFKSIISDMRNYGAKHKGFLRTLFDGALFKEDIQFSFDTDFLSTWNNMMFVGRLPSYKYKINNAVTHMTFRPGYQVIDKEFVFSMLHVSDGNDAVPTNTYAEWSRDAAMDMSVLGFLKHVSPTCAVYYASASYVVESYPVVKNQGSSTSNPIDLQGLNLISTTLYAESDHALTPSEVVYASLGKVAYGNVSLTNPSVTDSQPTLVAFMPYSTIDPSTHKYTLMNGERDTVTGLQNGWYLSINAFSTELWNTCVFFTVNASGRCILSDEYLDANAGYQASSFGFTITTKAQGYPGYTELILIDRLSDFWRLPPMYAVGSRRQTVDPLSNTGYGSVGLADLFTSAFNSGKLHAYHTTEMVASMTINRLLNIFTFDLLSMLDLDVRGNFEYDTAN